MTDKEKIEMLKFEVAYYKQVSQEWADYSSKLASYVTEDIRCKIRQSKRQNIEFEDASNE